MIEIIGWVGAFLLATCGIPQVYKSVKTKDFSGLSILFILWWGIGEVLVLYYVINRAFRWPLLFNYGLNIIAVFIILGFYLKYGGRKKLD